MISFRSSRWLSYSATVIASLPFLVCLSSQLAEPQKTLAKARIIPRFIGKPQDGGKDMEPQMNADKRRLDRVEMSRLTKEVIRRLEIRRVANTF